MDFDLMLIKIYYTHNIKMNNLSDWVVNLTDKKAASSHTLAHFSFPFLFFNQYLVLGLVSEKQLGFRKPSALLCWSERGQKLKYFKIIITKTQLSSGKFIERYLPNISGIFIFHITKSSVVTDTLKIINAKIPLWDMKNLGHFRDGIMSMLILGNPWDPDQKSLHSAEKKKSISRIVEMMIWVSAVTRMPFIHVNS